MLAAVGSTDRRNTRCKLFSWRLILQGLTGPLVELTGDGAELGVGMDGKGVVGEVVRVHAGQFRAEGTFFDV